MTNTKQKDLFLIIAIPITALLIGLAAVKFEQSIFRIAPLYISLVVSALQSHVNRYGSLLGGLNSIIYSLVYIYYGLYSLAAQAFLFSFPIQVVTFINWGKKTVDKKVRIKALSFKARLLWLALIVVAQFVIYFLLGTTDSNYAFLDSLISVVGTASTILMIFPYIEYTYTLLTSSTLTVVLYVLMLKETPEQATFLIYSLFSIVCIVKATIRALKLYKSQNQEEKQ